MTPRAFLILAPLLVVAACAVRPTIPGTEVRWDERRAKLLDLASWEARGRIGVKAGDSGGQGNIVWQQSEDGSRIRVNGPFGAGAYEMIWSDDRITIVDKNGAVDADYVGDDAAERLLAERLGWSFPADSSRYWILGVAHPAYPARERFDTDGWLDSIEQNGWRIEYEGFSARSGTWLPRRISIENPRARVKVVIDRWRL